MLVDAHVTPWRRLTSEPPEVRSGCLCDKVLTVGNCGPNSFVRDGPTSRPWAQRNGRPARWRTAAVTVVAGNAAFVTTLSLRLLHSQSPTRFDSTADTWLSPVRAAARHGGVLVELGSPAVMVGACFALAVLFGAAGRGRFAAVAVLAPTTALAVTELLLKPVVHRTGAGGGFLFPSGHATGVTAFGLIVILAVAPGGPLRARLTTTLAAVVGTIAALFVVAVSVTLTASRYHFATDVLAGGAVATTIVGGFAAALHRPSESHRCTEFVSSARSQGSPLP